MALFNRNRETIGLDIGSALVKAALVDHSSGEPRLVRLAALPLATDAIVEGEIMDPANVVETVDAVVQSLGTRVRSVVTAVGGRDVIIKKISMDRLPLVEAREVIPWEAEQYVPFDMENVEVDFQILDPAAEGQQMSVLLVAAKKELIEQRLMLLTEAGLSAGLVDVDAFALFNAFEFNYPAHANGYAVLVHVGHEVTVIIVQEDGVPILTRDTPFGSKHLREEFRRLHGLSGEQADSVLTGKVAPSPECQAVLTERYADLALAIERATAFLSADFAGAAGIGAVYLSGGAAGVPRLEESLAERLRVKVELINPLQRLNIGPDALTEWSNEETASMWLLSVGLALRERV